MSKIFTHLNSFNDHTPSKVLYCMSPSLPGSITTKNLPPRNHYSLNHPRYRTYVCNIHVNQSNANFFKSFLVIFGIVSGIYTWLPVSLTSHLNITPVGGWLSTFNMTSVTSQMVNITCWAILSNISTSRVFLDVSSILLMGGQSRMIFNNICSWDI